MGIPPLFLNLTADTVSDNRLLPAGTCVGVWCTVEKHAEAEDGIRPAELAKWIATGRVETYPRGPISGLREVRWSKDHNFAPFAPEPPALVDDFREVDKAIVDVEGQA